MPSSDDDNVSGKSDNNSVGQACPTRRRRFKDSRNTKGRPVGSKNKKTIVRQVALEKHTVMEGGKKVRHTTLELVLMRLRNMALDGKNTQAVAEFYKWLEKLEPSPQNQNGGLLVVPAEMSEEEWIANVERENATKVRPEY